MVVPCTVSQTEIPGLDPFKPSGLFYLHAFRYLLESPIEAILTNTQNIRFLKYLPVYAEGTF